MQKIPRRVFIALAGSALVCPKFLFGESAPTVLDHILLGCNDLDRGIAFVEEHTGVRAAFGGVHPGRGTRNALLSLGEKHYLEIIAPDPQQTGAPDSHDLQKLSEPRLVGWAAHPGDIDRFAAHLRESNIPFEGPTPGSRKRPDGRRLQWKTLNLENDRAEAMNFTTLAVQATEVGSFSVAGAHRPQPWSCSDAMAACAGKSSTQPSSERLRTVRRVSALKPWQPRRFLARGDRFAPPRGPRGRRLR